MICPKCESRMDIIKEDNDGFRYFQCPKCYTSIAEGKDFEIPPAISLPSKQILGEKNQ